MQFLGLLRGYLVSCESKEDYSLLLCYTKGKINKEMVVIENVETNKVYEL